MSSVIHPRSEYTCRQSTDSRGFWVMTGSLGNAIYHYAFSGVELSSFAPGEAEFLLSVWRLMEYELRGGNLKC